MTNIIRQWLRLSKATHASTIRSRRASGFAYYSAKLSFGIGKRLSFYKKIRSKLTSGLDLMTAIQEMHHVYSANKPNHYLVVVLGDVITNVEDGAKFYRALDRWASPGEVMLIQAGENSGAEGAIITALDNVVATTESLNRIKGSLIKSLTYPIVLVAATLALIIYFSTLIIPQLINLSSPETWSDLTRLYASIVSFIGDYYPFLVAAVVGFTGVAFYSLPIWTGEWRRRVDSVPPWSIYRITQGAIFLNAVAGLLKAGMDITSVIKELKANASPYLRTHLGRMLRVIGKGESPGTAFNTGLFGFETQMDLIIYDRTIDFSSAMKELSQSAIQSVIARTELMGRIVSTVTLFILASFVVGSFLSLWDMVGSTAMQGSAGF